MQPLRMISLLAANSLPTYRSVAGYLSHGAGLRVELAKGVPWAEQEHMIDQGEADLGAMCGLLYTRKAAWLELLAAPVPSPTRYERRPIYFSDIVVPRASSFQSFGDLRGARPYVLSYSSLELPGGDWANLVLLQHAAGMEHWRASPKHAYAKRELAPRFYTTIRLHNGALAGGLAAERITLLRTKYYDFRAGCWHATREFRSVE